MCLATLPQLLTQLESQTDAQRQWLLLATILLPLLAKLASLPSLIGDIYLRHVWKQLCPRSNCVPFLLGPLRLTWMSPRLSKNKSALRNPNPGTLNHETSIKLYSTSQDNRHQSYFRECGTSEALYLMYRPAYKISVENLRSWLAQSRRSDARHPRHHCASWI
jgi:hypothetical protein